MLKSLLITFLLIGMNSFAADSKKTMDAQAKKQFTEILKQYENVHMAFFEYKGEKVEKEAKKLRDEIAKIKDPEISKLLSFSQEKLKAIGADKKKEENNQNLHLVSMALIKFINSYNIDDKYKAYTCPMVKMQWIQNTDKISEVHNPYADDMPHCGMQAE